MKVINPNDELHTINFVPRYLIGFDNVILYLRNEATRYETNNPFAETDVDSSGIIIMTFFLEVEENDKYEFWITPDDSDEIVYRGKFIATSQVPQDYKLTNEKYTY